ncbi:hypothetical protein [Arthrobacter sp. MMS18-M83]|uniref:hypothetical protein n=1 Tax=Arthrobacter sp. MMS18-M83 TaxID=2996261 RepID=UPI00227C08AF|nr:hypothetical protein [Arthrobacter sp. MMS18-M83]WAH99159.1 hypothetical protein OW521_10200 [Arthrobacter sp. MMS18-M83]
MQTIPESPSHNEAQLPAPLPDWSQLSRHDTVKVCCNNANVLSGRIDMIAYDRSVFWLIQDAGMGRIMICDADNPVVTRIPPTLEVR